ncbi:MAG TPA: hypothetical protein VIY48_12365, partial [Candidatus Paceibacterota bacterium]
MNLMIGADPEFFVRRGVHFIPGHTFPCGTKNQPKRTDHGFVQVDGIALECNVRPSETRSEFIRNTTGVIADLRNIVASVDARAEVVARPSIFFGHKRLSKLPPHVAELGCNADFNAWTGRRNPPPDAASPIRTGAGHIHIGWTKNENPREFGYFNQCMELVRQLDYYLGLPSLLWDKDNRRRSLYGRAGAFRPKSYGLEYRVLSNAWLQSDKMIGWVFDRTVQAVVDAWAGNSAANVYGEQAAAWINSNEGNWPKLAPGIAEQV